MGHMTDQPQPPQAQASGKYILPVVAPAGMTIAPLLLILGYVVATFLLFLLWPIDWPIYHTSAWVTLIGYVTLCLAALSLGARRGAAGKTAVVAQLPNLSLLLAIGALASAVVLIPSTLAYTGRSPWELLEALADQAAAYKRLQIQLFATSGQRTTIVALRTLAAPLTYAVLPLGIINWGRIGWIGRISVLVVVMTSVVFSIMRGTDKEIADLILIGLAACLVSLGRSIASGESWRGLTKKLWKPLLIGLVCLFLAQGLFTDRKDARLGGFVSRTAVCANNSRICADLDNSAIAWLPLRQRFGATVFILSACSGYYGLELAMEKPFESTWGAGHSPAALSIYEALTDDPTLRLRTFTYRNGADHWSDEFYWSTLITWIANDVGFVGAPFVLALIGFFWGLWWREAAAGFSDAAAVLFVLATTMVFYLPANNQVLASYEGYSILASWTAVWLWERSRRRLSAIVPVYRLARA